MTEQQQPAPVTILQGWRREYDRNTGNWDSQPVYTMRWADGTEHTTHTVPNKWLHLIVVDTKK